MTLETGADVTEAQARERSRLYPLWLEQALKFFSVGLLNTALDAGLYFVLTRGLGLGELRTLAKALSYSAGVLNSFYWNKSWTFRSEAGALKTLAPFVFANLLGLALNAGVMHLCLNALGWHELLSLALATGAVFGWNFGVSKFVIFQK